MELEFYFPLLHIIASLFRKLQIRNTSKLKEFGDENFNFDENGRKFPKIVENNVGKGRNCSLRAISPFHTVLLKDFYCRHIKNQGLFGKGLIIFSGSAFQDFDFKNLLKQNLGMYLQTVPTERPVMLLDQNGMKLLIC